MSLDALLDQAIASAWNYLVQQGSLDFPEATHVMHFPRAAGFSGPGQQSSDVFARAILGNLFCDLAAITPASGDVAAPARELARREADRLAGCKLPHRVGGWSYFPDLPELPPDLDSLSAAIALFARVAPQHVPLCAAPIALALQGAGADGAIETWLVSPADAAADRVRMEWAIRACWGRGTDPDVLASFCAALTRLDAVHYRDWIARFIGKLAALQQDDGRWRGTWYGDGYTTTLALRAMILAGADDAGTVARARGYLGAIQPADGGWGSPIATPLDTAMALWGLGADSGELPADVADAAVVALAGNQNPDGSWFSSAWIKMPIGRATGQVLRTATWESVTITTAFCLRSLAAIRYHRSVQ